MKAEQTKAEIEPIVKSVAVSWSPEASFRRFTDEIGTWWPLETHSLSGERAKTLTMEVERAVGFTRLMWTGTRASGAR